MELAKFIIDGECPKCGKIITKGHKKHLAMCTGKSAYEPTLAELIEIEVKKVENLDKKLVELEVGGLIDLTEEHALFMVIGSTGALSPPHGCVPQVEIRTVDGPRCTSISVYRPPWELPARPTAQRLPFRRGQRL